MVAKSYQNMPVLGEPYAVNGRMYVKVMAATGEKQVRWYSDSEYEKLYGFAVAAKPVAKTRFRTQKDTLGFINGFISICKGATYENKDWYKSSGAKYNKFFGWYFPSDMALPTDCPDAIEYVMVKWELVGNDHGDLKSDYEVKAAVENLLYPVDETTDYAGEVGDKLELYLTVDKAITMEGYYGISTMHIMHDDCGNVYVWSTSARKLVEGNEYHIKGVVKEHKMYRGVKQTVLTRCKEV